VHEDPHNAPEASKRTIAMVGDLYVQPVVMDYQGKRALVFAFPVGTMIAPSGHKILQALILRSIVFSSPGPLGTA